MGILRGEKLRGLLQAWEPHTAMTRAGLSALGVTPQNTQKYVASGWLEPVAAGVFKLPQDTLNWQGALYSLQRQQDLKVHVGALTALEADGAAHNLRLAKEQVFLFSAPKTALPAWFRRRAWDADVH